MKTAKPVISKRETYESWVEAGSDGKKEYAPYVWLTEHEFRYLSVQYGSDYILKEWILMLSNSKQCRNSRTPSKFNYQLHYKDSGSILKRGWVWQEFMKHKQNTLRYVESELMHVKKLMGKGYNEPAPIKYRPGLRYFDFFTVQIEGYTSNEIVILDWEAPITINGSKYPNIRHPQPKFYLNCYEIRMRYAEIFGLNTYDCMSQEEKNQFNTNK